MGGREAAPNDRPEPEGELSVALRLAARRSGSGAALVSSSLLLLAERLRDIPRERTRDLAEALAKLVRVSLGSEGKLWLWLVLWLMMLLPRLVGCIGIVCCMLGSSPTELGLGLAQTKLILKAVLL